MSDVLTEAARWLVELQEPLWDPAQLAVERVAPDCAAGLFFLAWSGPRALGTMRLTDADPLFWPEASGGEALYLHRLAVRRSAAGGAVSSALLGYAARTALARELPFLRLDCLADRPGLRGVYERFGFCFHSERTVRGAHVARYQLRATSVDWS